MANDRPPRRADPQCRKLLQPGRRAAARAVRSRPGAARPARRHGRGAGGAWRGAGSDRGRRLARARMEFEARRRRAAGRAYAKSLRADRRGGAAASQGLVPGFDPGATARCAFGTHRGNRRLFRGDRAYVARSNSSDECSGRRTDPGLYQRFGRAARGGLVPVWRSAGRAELPRSGGGARACGRRHLHQCAGLEERDIGGFSRRSARCGAGRCVWFRASGRSTWSPKPRSADSGRWRNWRPSPPCSSMAATASRRRSISRFPGGGALRARVPPGRLTTKGESNK